jgi:hypothetical protein
MNCGDGGLQLLRDIAVDVLLHLRPDRALGEAELIVRLHTHPDLRRRAEVSAEPESVSAAAHPCLTACRQFF